MKCAKLRHVEFSQRTRCTTFTSAVNVLFRRCGPMNRLLMVTGKIGVPIQPGAYHLIYQKDGSVFESNSGNNHSCAQQSVPHDHRDKYAPDGWDSARFQAVGAAGSWFRQNGVISSR